MLLDLGMAFGICLARLLPLRSSVATVSLRSKECLYFLDGTLETYLYRHFCGVTPAPDLLLNFRRSKMDCKIRRGDMMMICCVLLL